MTNESEENRTKLVEGIEEITFDTTTDFSTNKLLDDRVDLVQKEEEKHINIGKLTKMIEVIRQSETLLDKEKSGSIRDAQEVAKITREFEEYKKGYESFTYVLTRAIIKLDNMIDIFKELIPDYKYIVSAKEPIMPKEIKQVIQNEIYRLNKDTQTILNQHSSISTDDQYTAIIEAEINELNKMNEGLENNSGFLGVAVLTKNTAQIFNNLKYQTPAYHRNREIDNLVMYYKNMSKLGEFSRDKQRIKYTIASNTKAIFDLIRLD